MANTGVISRGKEHDHIRGGTAQANGNGKEADFDPLSPGTRKGESFLSNLRKRVVTSFQEPPLNLSPQSAKKFANEIVSAIRRDDKERKKATCVG